MGVDQPPALTGQAGDDGIRVVHGIEGQIRSGDGLVLEVGQGDRLEDRCDRRPRARIRPPARCPGARHGGRAPRAAPPATPAPARVQEFARDARQRGAGQAELSGQRRSRLRPAQHELPQHIPAVPVPQARRRAARTARRPSCRPAPRHARARGRTGFLPPPPPPRDGHRGGASPGRAAPPVVRGASGEGRRSVMRRARLPSRGDFYRGWE